MAEPHVVSALKAKRAERGSAMASYPAHEPLSATEIAERVMAQKGLDAGDGATMVMIGECVQSYLRRHRGRFGRQ